MSKKFFFYLALPLVLFTYSCADDDDPEIENEEEVITEVILTLTPDAGGASVVFTFSDPDGEGGNDGTATVSGPLAANTSYSAAITFANEDEAITPEVMEEDDEHQVFYTTSNALLSFAYADSDGDGNPLGLATTATTLAAGNGSLTVTLIHEPDKSAAGISIANPAVAGGSTDVNVVFDYEIQ